MNRHEYSDYLNNFDALLAKIENPSIAKLIQQGVKNGMRTEEIAHFYGISVESIQNDLCVLEQIQTLTKSVSKEL